MWTWMSISVVGNRCYVLDQDNYCWSTCNFISKLKNNNYYMFMNISLNVFTMFMLLVHTGSIRGIEFYKPGIKIDCELHVGAGDWTLVL